MADIGGFASQYSRTYNSFSGCDIQATFGPSGVKIGELQGVSFTITREKAPIYTMGQKDPRGFARGKRGIAGSLVFAVFDRSSLLSSMATGNASNFITSTDEQFLSAYRTGASSSTISRTAAQNARIPQGATDPLSTAGATGILSEDPRSTSYRSVAAWYLDQIPPFNIVLNAINEYGAAMVMRLHNCEILNNGSGISIDDIMIDETMTFTCTNIVPWQTKPNIDPTGISNDNVYSG